MRLLVTADLHLDKCPQYADDRLGEQEAVWKRALDLGVEHGCDAVLFGGDATEHRSPSSAARAAFQRPLVGYPLPVIAVNGNHDLKHTDIPTAIELAGRELGGGLLTASSRPELIRPGNLPLYIATLPSVTPAWLRARLDGGDVDDVNAMAARLLLDAARGLLAEARSMCPVWPCVLLGHFPTSGWATPDGFATDDMRTVVLPLHELEALGFDAVVLGDIHKGGIISGEVSEPGVDPRLAGGGDSSSRLVSDGEIRQSKDVRPGSLTSLVLSPGSLIALDFGEAACDHGCWLLDVEAGRAEATFLPIESRSFLTIEYDLVDQITEAPVEELPEHAAVIASRVPTAGTDLAPIFKVKIRATDEQARRIDQAKIKRALLDAGAHRAYLEPTIVREARARVEGMDEHVGDHQALELWLTANDVDEDTASGLRARHQAYAEALA